LCPRSENLKQALVAWKEGGVETVVSLLEKDEAVWLGIGEEAHTAKELGLNFLSFPIPDSNTPLNPAAFRAFVAALADRLVAGERICVHCRGSIGRATITTACTLIHLGFSAATALAAVEAARGCAVPDTLAQERWILNYRPLP
jgi:protein-tyrosine phosphatase